MTFDDDLPDDLSDNPTSKSISMLIGHELFSRLSEELGGRKIYIPFHPGTQSPMAVCIGLDAAQKISQIYGGMDFTIPLRAGIRSQILKLMSEGVPKARIPHIVRVSRSSVYRILEEEAAKSQMDLFS